VQLGNNVKSQLQIGRDENIEDVVDSVTKSLDMFKRFEKYN
jgi:hypothetical protein